jgi:prepilin-type N-terminal cleavage/methylation domain-containing protein
MGDPMTTPRVRLVRQRGLTLVELAVVLTIAALLYTQAAPMFAVWIGNTQTFSLSLRPGRLRPGPSAARTRSTTARRMSKTPATASQ